MSSDNFLWTDELACDFHRFICEGQPLSNESLLNRFKQRHTPQSDSRDEVYHCPSCGQPIHAGEKCNPPKQDSRDEGINKYVVWWTQLLPEIRQQLKKKHKMRHDFLSNEEMELTYHSEHTLSSPPDSRDWEIESYINIKNDEIFQLASVWNNHYYREGFKDYTGGFKSQQDVFKIHSVKRLSTNYIVSIGDWVQSIRGYRGKVVSFHPSEDGNMYVGIEGYDNEHLSNIEPSTQPEEETKPLTERMEVGIGISWKGGMWNSNFKTPKREIGNDAGRLIHRAIESVLNDDVKRGKDVYVNIPPGETILTMYTKKEVDEMCEMAFNESRLTHPMIGFKHDNFQDYKQKQQSK